MYSHSYQIDLFQNSEGMYLQREVGEGVDLNGEVRLWPDYFQGLMSLSLPFLVQPHRIEYQVLHSVFLQ